jgi:protein-S-isoprenylcysteine O-methyltransferase Ste14
MAMNVLIYLISMGLTVLLGYVVFRVKVRRDYQRQQDLSLAATLLEFLIFAVHANVSYVFLDTPWPYFPPLPQNTLQAAAGIVLAVLGLVLTLMGMRSLSFGKTVGQQQTTALHRAGFYRYSRNPQLVTYGVMLVGCTILWPSWYAVGWLLVYGAIAHMMVKTEEEHLARVFGEEYAAYSEEVPRFFGLG